MGRSSLPCAGMSNRLSQLAKENEEIAERGAYLGPHGAMVAIGPALAVARAGTVSYPPEGPASRRPVPVRCRQALVRR